MLETCGELQGKLAAMTGGDAPLILPAGRCARLRRWLPTGTGIPVVVWSRNEVEAILKIADTEPAWIGQRHGARAIARRIQTSRAKLDNPEQADRRSSGHPSWRWQNRNGADPCENASTAVSRT